MSDISEDTTFGGFVLASMELALPMSALREVLPYRELRPLPSQAACVRGGIDMRGVVIPVVDLRVVLGHPTPDIELPCVIVVVYEGKVLGLLAEKVTGIFTNATSDIKRVKVDDASLLLLGGVRRQDTNDLVSVLSPSALLGLRDVPVIDDPEPTRQIANNDRILKDSTFANEQAVTMMLVRCGRSPLALEAMGVHTTISCPEIRPSVLAVGHCRGVISHAGMNVPALDLRALCGLGSLDLDASLQAFIVLLPEGYVALLVSEVVDIVRTFERDVIPVPAFALPAKGLFSGALATSSLPTELHVRQGAGSSQYLVIDSAALKLHDEVVSMARANTPLVKLAADLAGEHAVQAVLAGRATQSEIRHVRNFITYDLANETATPLPQIEEILPYSSEISAFQTQGALLGLLVNRGRSIAVFCLRSLHGLSTLAPDAQTSVLVVDIDGELVGFAVPRLRSIETASWEPELNPGGGSAARKLALVAEGSGKPGRMLPVSDLYALARGLRDTVV